MSLSTDSTSKKNYIIGRIVISKDKPASPYSFWCTVETDSPEIQIGTYVVCELRGGLRTIVGIIEDMENASEYTASMQYYSSQMPPGPSISPTVLRYAKVRIVGGSPLIYAPPEDIGAPVRLIHEKGVEVLFQQIPENSRILAGFIQNSDLPVYLHADYVLGPEAAHINISGKTGLATKTSYAVFLAYSILAWSKGAGRNVVIVMVNVKRDDLMILHRMPKDWDEFKRKITEWAKSIGLNPDRFVDMWNIAKDQYGIDPFEYRDGVRYFTFDKDIFDPYERDGYKEVIHYSYGLADITTEELIAALYRPEETNIERQVNALYTYMGTAGDRRSQLTFRELKDDLEIYRRYEPRQRNRMPPVHVALDDWHTMTMGALSRRVDGFLSEAKHIVVTDAASGKPITFSQLCEKPLNVVQISGLSEAEQRLVVNALLREVHNELERMRVKEKETHVLVFIDELNKYAPRTASPIKEQIIEIAERGRFLRLSLMGCQQFASQIDNRVYENSSVKVVGNSGDYEITHEIYRYLGEFRKIAPLLKKGELIVYQDIYTSPLVIEFPPPPHVVRVSRYEPQETAQQS